MGFLANMKSAGIFKKGKKHADKGNFEKALVYFDDASRAATDGKTLYEHRSWYYLTRAIAESKAGEAENAKVSYKKFMDEFKAFEVECNKTPGFGTTARFNTTGEALQQFTQRYSQYVIPIEKE